MIRTPAPLFPLYFTSKTCLPLQEQFCPVTKQLKIACFCYGCLLRRAMVKGNVRIGDEALTRRNDYCTCCKCQQRYSENGSVTYLGDPGAAWARGRAGVGPHTIESSSSMSSSYYDTSSEPSPYMDQQHTAANNQPPETGFGGFVDPRGRTNPIGGGGNPEVNNYNNMNQHRYDNISLRRDWNRDEDQGGKKNKKDNKDDDDYDDKSSRSKSNRSSRSSRSKSSRGSRDSKSSDRTSGKSSDSRDTGRSSADTKDKKNNKDKDKKSKASKASAKSKKSRKSRERRSHSEKTRKSRSRRGSGSEDSERSGSLDSKGDPDRKKGKKDRKRSKEKRSEGSKETVSRRKDDRSTRTYSTSESGDSKDKDKNRKKKKKGKDAKKGDEETRASREVTDKNVTKYEGGNKSEKPVYSNEDARTAEEVKPTEEELNSSQEEGKKRTPTATVSDEGTLMNQRDVVVEDEINDPQAKKKQKAFRKYEKEKKRLKLKLRKDYKKAKNDEEKEEAREKYNIKKAKLKNKFLKAYSDISTKTVHEE